MAKFKKTLLLIFISAAILSLAASAMPPAPNYCEHMGYNYTHVENSSQGQGLCQFNENASCTAEAFMNGSCGQEYVKELSCRGEGEAVFTEFESCCEGLEPYLPPGTLGQPTCQPEKSLLQHISANISFILQLIGHLIPV